MSHFRKHVIKLSLVVGALALVALFVPSCLPSIFNQPPQPAISIVQGSAYGPPPLEITFDISGSHDPDGKIVSFSLDFADGSQPVKGTDLTQPISHTFTVPGEHFVTLNVVDNSGEARITQLLVVVSQQAP